MFNWEDYEDKKVPSGASKEDFKKKITDAAMNAIAKIVISTFTLLGGDCSKLEAEFLDEETGISYEISFRRKE